MKAKVFMLKLSEVGFFHDFDLRFSWKFKKRMKFNWVKKIIKILQWWKNNSPIGLFVCQRAKNEWDETKHKKWEKTDDEA